MSTISERATTKPPQYRSRIVEDDDFARALDYLRDSAPEVGKARAEEYVTRGETVKCFVRKGKDAKALKG